MYRISRLGTGACVMLLATSAVFANGTDTGPGTPVDAYPFNDTGFLDDTSFNDDITTYGGPCGTNLPFSYAGAEVFYEFDGATDSTYNLTLTSDNPGGTDFVLYILTDFADSASCVVNSQDSIDDVNPEEIAGFTPAANASHYIVIDAFSDGAGYPAYGSWTLDIACTGSCPVLSGGTPPTITSGAPPANVVIGNSYSHTFTATGDPAPTFSMSPALPAWLNLDANTGVLSGTPASGDAGGSFTVTASNGVAPDDTQDFSIAVSGTPPTITSGTPPANVVVGDSYSHTFTATGDPAPTFSVSPALPAWLNLDANTGVLSGTPAPGDAGGSFTLTASNGVAPDATQDFSIAVAGAAPISVPTLGHWSLILLGMMLAGLGVFTLGRMR